jgi:hypothetical protein
MASLPPTTFPDGVVAGEIRVDAPLPGRIGWGAYRAQAIRFVRFAIVGGLASIVYLALFAVLVGLGVHYLVAGTIGYLTAIATNFAVNRHWTFGRGIRAIHVQAASFLLVQLLVGVVNLFRRRRGPPDHPRSAARRRPAGSGELPGEPALGLPLGA